jgi:hypothetical protein
MTTCPCDLDSGMIRSLTYASSYVYSPRGVDAASERSRLLRAMLKACDSRFIFKYAGRVRQQVADRAPLAGFFCSSAFLVPIPGSAPSGARRVPVAEHLAQALFEEGLGGGIWPVLHRVCPVTKSATAVPGTRPSVAQHYESFAVAPIRMSYDGSGQEPCHLVLIDDVVTKGRTLLAAAARVQEAFPNAEIRAFALLRTLGSTRGLERLVDPCIGEIRWQRGDACRRP